MSENYPTKNKVFFKMLSIHDIEEIDFGYYSFTQVIRCESMIQGRTIINYHDPMGINITPENEGKLRFRGVF